MKLEEKKVQYLKDETMKFDKVKECFELLI